MNKNLGIALVFIILAGGVYYWYGHKATPALQETQQANETTGTQSTGETPTAPEGIGKHSVKWEFKQVSEDKTTGAVKTKVTVTWDGTSHDAGTYEGTCAEVDGSNGTLKEGEVSGVLCWYAGAGDEIGVFSENGKFVLKHGEQQEPSGEGAGFRGNFKTIIAL